MKVSYFSIASLILLSGCQIDQHRKEQALGGVELSQKMGTALNDFREQEKASEISIMNALARAEKSFIGLDAARKNDELGRASADTEPQIQIISRLNEFVSGIAKNDANASQRLSQLNAELGSLMDPIPSTDDAILETQKSFAELAKPLPFMVQFNEVKSIVDDVNKNYQDVIKPKLEANKNEASKKP
jgi:hypothetical protein